MPDFKLKTVILHPNTLDMISEKDRLAERPDNKGWKKWGPYLAERQWGTVREDYSVYGDAWDFLPHDLARSKAYRWGEDGIGGISDNKQFLCLAFSFWNHADPILKERLFGLTNKQANHGEDVKELYYYLDSTPSHGYMEMLYKYPINEFPYEDIIIKNRYRSKLENEYEVIDTGVFDADEYFDIKITYAKADKNDLYIKVSATNRSKKDADLSVLPTLWFRNTWSFGYEDFKDKPEIRALNKSAIKASHNQLGNMYTYFNEEAELVFCENETNRARVYGKPNEGTTYKDGINNYLINQDLKAINANKRGTKAAANHKLSIKAGQTEEVILRFTDLLIENEALVNAEEVFRSAKNQADAFYAEVQKNIKSAEKKNIQRQAFAGMMWNKQFYYYNVEQWAEGDPVMPFEFNGRAFDRNREWKHAYMANILSMPDKWEYPWFAAWDLAFHTPTLARIDPDFAKRQLAVILREYYMHPNGQIPAYEWNFSDVNPPVHAWATWKVYEIDKYNAGVGDLEFLERIFHKLLLNFTWWVNQKDEDGNNLFGGGFLGLDNIGVFDRNTRIPGHTLQQADATGWMALYTLNMLRISAELAAKNPTYQDMCSKFFEHFLHIAEAINQPLSVKGAGLWDEEEGFYFDKIHAPDGRNLLLKIKSLVGLLPLCAVEILTEEQLEGMPEFKKRLNWIAKNKPELQHFVSEWHDPNERNLRIFSLVNKHRLKTILEKLLAETEFLSDYGIRSMSKYHKENPYSVELFGQEHSVKYSPGESELNIMGGNSNWRGPIWFPLNYLILDSLKKYAHYFGNEFKVKLPNKKNASLYEAIALISARLVSIFETDNKGKKAFNGGIEKFDKDPNFKELIHFYEYFDGDTGRGLGAAHQTGWTGLVADLILESEN